MTSELDGPMYGRSVLEWVADLKAPSDERRELAVAALVRGDPLTARAVLQSADPAFGEDVAEAHEAVLAGISEGAVAPLMERVDLPDAWGSLLVTSLAAIGGPAVPALLLGAQDRERPWVGRMRCLGGLAAMRPQPEGVNELLVRTMYEPAEPEPVRLAAAVGIASWARQWVEADPVGAGLLARCATADAKMGDAVDAAARAARVAAAARRALSRDPDELAAAVAGARAAAEPASEQQPVAGPAGWRSRRRGDGLSLDLEYFDGERWTGLVAASGLGAGVALDVLAHEELLAAAGPQLAGAVSDAATVAAVEHDDDLAQAAGYRVLESRRTEAAAAAQRLRDLGASVRAGTGEAGIDELVEVLALLGHSADAERARDILRGGRTSAEP